MTKKNPYVNKSMLKINLNVKTKLMQKKKPIMSMTERNPINKNKIHDNQKDL